MMPQQEEVSGDELALALVRARDIPLRRQAAALLLLELAGADLDVALEGAPDDVTAALAPLRMSLR